MNNKYRIWCTKKTTVLPDPEDSGSLLMAVSVTTALTGGPTIPLVKMRVRNIETELIVS